VVALQEVAAAKIAVKSAAKVEIKAVAAKIAAKAEIKAVAAKIAAKVALLGQTHLSAPQVAVEIAIKFAAKAEIKAVVAKIAAKPVVEAVAAKAAAMEYLLKFFARENPLAKQFQMSAQFPAAVGALYATPVPVPAAVLAVMAAATA